MDENTYKTNPILSTLFAVTVLLASNAADAYSWPSFWAPDVAYLNQHHALRTASCPKGYAKLVPGMLFAIADECNTWCPKDWYWSAQATNECIPFEAFQLQDYQFKYTREPGHNHVQYTRITANYGASKEDIAFSMTFTTPPEAWDCYAPNGIDGMVDCANDI